MENYILIQSDNLLKYLFVGAAGFLIEIGIINLYHAISPDSFMYARFISFPLAVLATWMLNRKLTFKSSAEYRNEIMTYGVVQSIGAIINLTFYYGSLLYIGQSTIYYNFIFCLSAILSMGFTYMCSAKFVFKDKE
jgi:putative flippase GtrA